MFLWGPYSYTKVCMKASLPITACIKDAGSKHAQSSRTAVKARPNLY